MVCGCDDDGKRSVVGHVFDDVGTEGIVQRHPDESERVTREIDNLPFGSIEGPDADGKVCAVNVFRFGAGALGAGTEFPFVFESEECLPGVETTLPEFAVCHLGV